MSALSTGICAGLALGVPFGPVGVLALRYAAHGAFAQIWALACGTVAAEAAMAVFVGSTIGPRLSKVFAPHPSVRFVFAAVVVLMGLAMIIRPVGQPPRRPTGWLLGLGQGAMITLLNPGVAAGYAAIFLSNGEVLTDVTSVLELAVGVVIGSGAWWSIGVPALRRLVRIGRPEWMATVVRVLGFLFVVLGSVLGARAAFVSG